MPTINGKSRLLDAAGRPYRYDYDAVEDRKRRTPPLFRVLSEDKHLPAEKRKKLVATSNDLVRNFEIAAWAIRQHIQFVASFEPQVRSGDKGFDRELEAMLKWWGRAGNFDVRGRDSLKRYLRLAEVRRTLNGDVGTLKLSSGRVQAIEGDRIRTPTAGSTRTDLVEGENVVQGVVITKTGKPRGYCLHNRLKGGERMEFDRIIPARHFLMHGYYDRFDQVRGVGLVTPGINRLRDLYETMEFAQIRAKIHALFGIALKHGDQEAAGDLETTTNSDGSLDKSATEVDFGRGPFMMDLDHEDSIDTIESKYPPSDLKGFFELLIMVALRSLDLPLCFLDEARTNYSGQRSAWLLYDYSAEQKRESNREFLAALTAWRIMLWVIDGELTLPKGQTISTLGLEFLNRGIPWLDPLKEIKADREALESKLNSRTRILRRQGIDFETLVDEIAAENEYLEERLGPGSSEVAKKPAGPGAAQEIDVQELAEAIAESLADLERHRS